MSAIRPSELLLEARTMAGLTQQAVARRAGTAQSVVARIENGDSEPGFATLERLVRAAGFELAVTLVPPESTADPMVEAFKSDVDRTMLRENLKRTPEERVRALGSLARLAREARAAGGALRRTR